MDFAIEIQSEFDYIVRAFQFVASMFSTSSGYTGFIATLGVLGIFFGGMSAISAQAMSGRAAIQGWLINMLAASVVIVLLLGNKSTVVIHDTVSNQMRSVGGIPTVMAALAYMENRVENGVKDIITTVMAPIIPYDDIGKGEGFELLASLDKAAKTYITKYPYVMRSMEAYFEDCGLKDLSRGWISEDAIYKSADMWADLKSETETNFTVVYDTSQGTTYSCRAAWEKINAMMAAAQVQSAVEAQCKEKYKDLGAVNKCMQNQDSIAGAFLSGGAFTSIDLNAVIRSYLVSYAMHSSNGTLAVMLNDVNKKNASSAFMAEKMLPRLKGMMYGMMIGIFPLLVGFVWFNPAKTIVFYAGMFIMLVLWSAIDTFMDMQYQNEVYQMFSTIRDTGLGVNQMFDIPNISADAVALYGSGRWLAMGLATAISAAITGINSYAISQMGSQLGATAQSAAGAAAGYMDSAGRTALDKQAASDFGSRALADMMSVPNWTAYGAGQAMEVKASSVKNSMLTESNSMETVANNLGAAGANGAWKDAMSAQAELRALGGLAGTGRQAADSSTFNAYEQKARLDTANDIFKTLENAGTESGKAAGVNQAKSVSSVKGEIEGAGGTKELMDQTKEYAALNTGKTKEYLRIMDGLYGADAGKNLGFSEAYNAVANTEATKQKVNTYGADTFLDIAGKKGAFEIGRDFGSMNRYEETFGRKLNEAGEAMGDMEATNGMRNMAELNGRLTTVGGDHKKLMEQFHALGSTDQQRQMGSAEALKHKAQLMGMSVRKFQKFTDNGNTLDADTAEYLNERYNTDVFKEGQQFRFNAGEKGLTEMSITDNVKGKQLGSYTLDGTQSIILNDDGSVATNRYDGVFSKDGKTFAGGITLDGNEEIIAASGTTGSELYDKLIDTRTTQFGSQYSGVLHSILSGKKDSFERLEGLSGEELEAEKRLLAGTIATELHMFRNDTENQGWGTSVEGALEARGNLNFKSGEQLAGWLAEKASGLSADASLGINGRLGIDRRDRSESQQNFNAREIYNIISNANGDIDTMADHTKTYLQNKIGENLSGMGVAADAIKEGWDKFEQIGGTVGVTIGKNSETGDPMAEAIKSWEKK